MDTFYLDVIKEIYDDLKREYLEYDQELNKKKGDIEKIDSYLNNMLCMDENNAQVFLARKLESLYRDDIEYKRQEKEKLISECNSLEKYMSQEKSKIEKLKKIM